MALYVKQIEQQFAGIGVRGHVQSGHCEGSEVIEHEVPSSRRGNRERLRKSGERGLGRAETSLKTLQIGLY
jgi:hypothetical protein